MMKKTRNLLPALEKLLGWKSLIKSFRLRLFFPELLSKARDSISLPSKCLGTWIVNDFYCCLSNWIKFLLLYLQILIIEVLLESWQKNTHWFEILLIKVWRKNFEIYRAIILLRRNNVFFLLGKPYFNPPRCSYFENHRLRADDESPRGNIA